MYFRVFATESGTGDYIKEKFSTFTDIYPDIFITQSDQEIRFDNATIHDIVEKYQNSTLLTLEQIRYLLLFRC